MLDEIPAVSRLRRLALDEPANWPASLTSQAAFTALDPWSQVVQRVYRAFDLAVDVAGPRGVRNEHTHLVELQADSEIEIALRIGRAVLQPVLRMPGGGGGVAP